MASTGQYPKWENKLQKNENIEYGTKTSCKSDYHLNQSRYIFKTCTFQVSNW